MDERIVQFIAALRAQGVRVSVAESADAMRACQAISLGDKESFRAALQATLVKDQSAVPAFQELFPLYFSGDGPPMQPPQGLSEEEQQMLEDALRQMTPQQLAQLLQMLLAMQAMQGQQGQQSQQSQLGQMVQSALGQYMPGRFSSQQQAARRIMRDMELDRLLEKLEELLERLREQGMGEEQLENLRETAEGNMAALQEQIRRQVGQGLAQQQLEEAQERRPRESELMDRPFEHMSADDVTEMRKIVQRLAAQLRTRMALRQKRGATGQLDAKATIRKNQSYGGVPIEVKYKTRHLKPKLTILIDRSVSTENVTRFLLTLMYALQDQISRTRSFAFIEDLYDISPYFQEHRVERALDEVMQNVRSKRSYSTDLGTSLHTFVRDQLGSVDSRTTVIVLGDARNNENDPGLEHLAEIKRRARRLIWFNPEERAMWGRYDPGSLSSDMLKYAPLCDSVHQVSNMRQLMAAVDRLFTR
jgi:uncharacterized protein